jgi:hypothetical protein
MPKGGPHILVSGFANMRVLTSPDLIGHLADGGLNAWSKLRVTCH